MDDERDEPRRSQRQLTIRRRSERPLLGVLGWAGDGRERLIAEEQPILRRLSLSIGEGLPLFLEREVVRGLGQRRASCKAAGGGDGPRQVLKTGDVGRR